MDTRRIRALAISTPTVLVLLMGAAACSKSGDPQDKPQTSATSTSDSGTSPTSTGGSTGDTTIQGEGATKDLSNTDIKNELSASHPDLWAKVDFNRFSWTAFTGYNVIVSEDTAADQAVELCKAISDLVYDSDIYTPRRNTSIVIATSDNKTDLDGTPIVRRDDASGTCSAV